MAKKNVIPIPTYRNRKNNTGYTSEVKKNYALLSLSPGQSSYTVAHLAGVTQVAIHKWRYQFLSEFRITLLMARQKLNRRAS